MHLKKHLLFIFVIVFALGLIYFYALSDMFHPKQIASYENFTEMSEEFDASKEITEAAKKYQTLKTQAGIIKGNDKAVAKIIALTFDGMESRGNMEAILKIMTDYGWHATFFAEGVNAARNETVVRKMKQEEQLIGNYSFVGVSKAERLQPEVLLEQFCRTQKILKLVTGHEPKLFKLYDTRYTDDLLRAAKASGLDNAVQSDLDIYVRKLDNDAAMADFVAKIQQGMIVSLQLGRPAPIKYSQKKGPDTPAVDKQPTIQEKNTVQVKDVTTIEIVKNLCGRLKEKGFTVVTVNVINAGSKIHKNANPAEDAKDKKTVNN
ncbi:MAG: polysaccharide deacetylase family protein [Acidaminococcaceae bacterium]|nr:polysaccharide deacetylase family protein [Acidaminococcaceae bacterium]